MYYAEIVNSAMNRFIHCLVWMVTFLMSSLPIVFIQLGVWISMFGQFYQETQSVSKSTIWILDGQHRCDGCKLITDLCSVEDGNLFTQAPLQEKLSLYSVKNENFFFGENIKEIKRNLVMSLSHGIQSPWVELPPPKVVS